jgi:hypothetical protein
METDQGQKSTAIKVVTWLARGLGVTTAGFFLLMFIGEALQSGQTLPRFEPMAAIGLALIGVYIVAMFLALKWRRVGLWLGVPALGIFLVMLYLGKPGGFSHEGVLNPFLLSLWLPVLLYLVSWGLDRRKRARTKAGV